ncbi:hypothetical protein B0H12DRAFT_1074333 [Mycena haematopus]|nr:hypothetical protein B0H12DRAFT_1074333 [Mycena haematopus]
MKITEIVLGPGDYKFLPTADSGTYCWLQKEHYERIEERCWGRMNRDSPISGLCTDLVDTCFVFVFHCGANGRTTLSHVVSGIDIAVFTAQMQYVAGGDPLNQVDLVVFQGRQNDVPSEILEEDRMWLSETLDRIKTPSCNAFVYPKLLGYGLVLVEKSSGDVTIPIPPSRANNIPKFLRCVTSAPTPTTFAKRRLVDAFYRIQSTASYIASKRTSIPGFEVRLEHSVRLQGAANSRLKTVHRARVLTTAAGATRRNIGRSTKYGVRAIDVYREGWLDAVWTMERYNP